MGSRKSAAKRRRKTTRHRASRARTNHAIDSPLPRGFTIAAIGASAGGLDALIQMVNSLPADPGLVVVILQHMAPDHDSALPHLLAGHTPLPVIQVTHGLQMRANHVYVVPPNAQMTMSGDRLLLAPRPADRSRHLAREVAKRARAEDRVTTLLARLVTVQEEERRRIARNLHDHLGQQVTALRLSIGALKDHMLSAGALRGELDAIDEMASRIDREVDLLAWDLRPAALDDVGLAAALQTVVRDWSTTNGIDAEFHSTPPAVRLAEEIESQLYRIAQEALNNVSKHAAAKRVSVLLEHTDREVRLIVEDDGRGFDAAAADREHLAMGLTNMLERAALVGGQVEFESAPGKGTTVFARVPIRATTVSNR